MASFNRVILAGNLTRDPQLKYLPNNTPVCEFGLASNRKWRDKDGNSHEEVCFVDISAFGRQAETINQYMSKGKPILVEGRLKLDQWTAQDGSKRSKHTVVLENFTFLGGPRDSEGGGAPADAAPRASRPETSPGRSEEYAAPRAAAVPARGPQQRRPEPAVETYPAGPEVEAPPAGDDIPF
jgi:single-strand DNA-binding protein